MNCNEARHLMLEAEPKELEGAGSSALAGHIATCASCTANAGAILRGTAVLREAVVGARGRSAITMPRDRRRVATVMSFAAVLIAMVALGLLQGHESTVNDRARGPGTADIVIENAQGRAVTVVPGADTTVIVFWNRGAP